MSLRPDDRYGGGSNNVRSRASSVSGGGDGGRSRSRSTVRADDMSTEPSRSRTTATTRHSSYGYPGASPAMPGSFRDDDHDGGIPPPKTRFSSYGYPSASPAMPGSFRDDDNDDGTAPTYEVRLPPTARSATTADRKTSFPPPTRTISLASETAPFTSTAMPYPEHDHRAFNSTAAFPIRTSPERGGSYAPPTQNHYAPALPQQQQQPPPPPPGYPPPPRQGDGDLAYGAPRESLSRQSSAAYRYTPATGEEVRYAQAPQPLTYIAKPSSAGAPFPDQSSTPSRAVDRYQSSHQLARPEDRYQPNYAAPHQRPREQDPRSYARDGHELGAHVVDITPGRKELERTTSASSRTAHHLSTTREPSTVKPPLKTPQPRSPNLDPLTSRWDRLSVSGDRPDLHLLGVGGDSGGKGGGMPPPSPLLEPYYGTYQSISPMVLPLRPDDDLDLQELAPLSPTISSTTTTTTRSSHKYHDRLEHEADERNNGHSHANGSALGKKSKRVTLYDAEGDAQALAKALGHSKVNGGALCDILPPLSHDQVVELRKEYKKQVKVHGRGVNLSKHIKTKLTGHVGKVAYVTALGRWESEGYWANFWYQAHASRRELLIESLMGRSNAEIRLIKEDFRDKRYGDSLTRCMEKELKMDKFRTAVLLVLAERRQEEQDVSPPELVHRDVDVLHHSVRAEKGGETAMLEVVVLRSESHLREVLKLYERMHGENFARSALRKSTNLVGEVIAHILNGIINRPARDALLLQHAISDIAAHNKADELRYELLISRLVRIHWDKLHLLRVKHEYYAKYQRSLEDALAAATKGEFREFICELCETREDEHEGGGRQSWRLRPRGGSGVRRKNGGDGNERRDPYQSSIFTR